MKERQLADLESERNTAERLRSKLGMSRTGSEMNGGLNTGTKRGSPLRGSRTKDNASVSPHAQLGGFRSTHMRNGSLGPPPSNEFVESSMRKDPLAATSYGQPLQFYPSRLAKREFAPPIAPLRPQRPEII